MLSVKEEKELAAFKALQNAMDYLGDQEQNIKDTNVLELGNLDGEKAKNFVKNNALTLKNAIMQTAGHWRANTILAERYRDLVKELYDDFRQTPTSYVTGRPLDVGLSIASIKRKILRFIDAYSYAFSRHQQETHKLYRESVEKVIKSVTIGGKYFTEGGTSKGPKTKRVEG